MRKPDIPDKIVAKWQKIVDLMSKVIGVPAGLIMKVHPKEIEVFVSSGTEGNPYEKGEKAQLKTGLYCETVMAQRRQLLVPDARKNPKWDHNPDIKLNMVAYLGLPLIWPDGEIFGSICVLDNKENPYSAVYQKLLAQFRETVEANLQMILESEEHRKQIEEAQQKLEEKYCILFNEARDGIVLIDRETGQIIDCNAEFERQTGRSLVQLQKMKIWEIRPPGKTEAARKKFLEIKEKGRGSSADLAFQKPNGEIVLIEFISKPIKIKGRQYLQSISRDITEREKMEKALKRNQKSLAEAQRVAHLGNWNWDITTNELYWSDEIYRIFGLKPQEFGATYDAFLNLVHPDDRGLVKTSVNEALNNKKPYSIDHRIVLPDGKERIVHEHAEAFFNKSGKAIRMIGTVQDITERKQAEEKLSQALKEAIKSREIMVSMLDDNNQIRKELEKNLAELRKTQAQLIQSEKLASVGQMASGIAHEINNPLTVVSAEAEMLLMDKKKDKETKDATKIIMEQSGKIRAITERLLEFSRKKEFKLAPLGINDVIQKSLALLSYQVKIGNVKIVKKLASKLPGVLADSNQLQEVFLNIMLNAVQAMNEKGGLTITSRSESITEGGRRKTDIFKQGEEIVVVEFKDTGKGMDAETLNKVFDPFFTTKEKGTGLGLSICYGIIRNHNGIIEVESEPGKGCTFFVKFPVIGGANEKENSGSG